MTQSYNQLKKKRAIEFDTLIQKHKNKLKDVELNYKNEISDFKKTSTKGFKFNSGSATIVNRGIMSRNDSKLFTGSISPYDGRNIRSPFKMSLTNFSKTTKK